MKILTVEPKDIYVTLEMGLYEIKYLLDFLDTANVDYDSKENPDLAKACEWIDPFYKELEVMYKDIKGSG